MRCAAHQTSYASLLKKLNKVSSAKDSRSKNARNRFSKEPNGAMPGNISEVQAAPDLPTITDKLAADLGVDRTTVIRRHKKQSGNGVRDAHPDRHVQADSELPTITDQRPPGRNAGWAAAAGLPVS